MNLYNKVDLLEDEINKILSSEESWILDMKGKEIGCSKLTRTASAFANANGGEIYVGISHRESKNSYYLDGFSCIEDCNQIVDMLHKQFSNQNDCRIEFCYCPDNSIILHITIQKTQKVIFASNDIAYLRVGAQNVPQNTPEKIQQLKYDKGVSSYEDEYTTCEFNDICNSPVLLDFIREVVPKKTPYDLLKSQCLMDSQQRITIAGVLLFHPNPQAVIPKHSGIKVIRYHSTQQEESRDTLADGFPISIEGDIYTLISEAVKITRESVEESNVIGKDRIEAKEYPELVLHEIITNAVLHRDYSIATDIKIRIYTDRIEIESPGKLPGHITVRNILNEQLSRNAKIVRLLSKFPSPPNKDIGEGLNTAFREMERMNLKRPTISEKENSVVVVIRHERLADPEELIVKYLENNESINNAKGREITGISDTIRMKDVFVRLRDRGIIEPVPGLRGNASRWQLKLPNNRLPHKSYFSSDSQLRIEDVFK